MELEEAFLEETAPCRFRQGNRWEQFVVRPRGLREALERGSLEAGKFPGVLCRV